ncbi:MAG: class I SAM-dependent rRNA methyltransferase [Chitinophagales bacterium]|nr:class I SAM-dependent rRNA methyltransferase [Chitinophagales bacterium]
MEKKLFLKLGREDSVKRMHPWIFSGAIAGAEGELTDGDWVHVYDNSKKYLASGFLHDGSITIKIYSYHKSEPTLSFWSEKISNAYLFRQQLGWPNNQTNCYRLIHGEGDGFPGLIVDVYGDVAVFQAHSIGVFLHRVEIAEAIIQVSKGAIKAVYNKSSTTLPTEFAQGHPDGFILGETTPEIVYEHGYRFMVDWKLGQKTGFFLDQRDNRQLLGAYAQGKSVLNTFAYSGGFSIYAAGNGATKVDSVDVSKSAIDLLNKNFNINSYNNDLYNSYVVETIPFLKDCDSYDIIILDPPAYAKSISKRHNAVQGYKRLNKAGIDKVKKGGLLFTFSCSQVVDRNLFYNTVMSAAIETGRQARVIHHLSQPADHPVNIYHPEGAYLKGLVLRFD